MEEIPQISQMEARKMLSVDNIDRIIETRISERNFRDNLESITIGGTTIIIGGFLGSGGSKEVYSVDYCGKPYALGISGKIDGPAKILFKWYSVLMDPQNTERLRESGLKVNDFCQIVPVTINGFPFPAILMKRYQDHSFKIHDSKNRANYLNGSNIKDDEMCLEFMGGLIEDVRTLITEGICLGRDSFNACTLPTSFRLYFNDLGSAQFCRFSSSEIDSVASEYASYAKNAFIKSFSDNAIVKNPYLDGLISDSSSLEAKMKEIVLSN